MARNGNIGIGIWGAGWVSGGHASAYKSTPGCAIVAVGSRRRESAARLARDQSLDCRIYDDYGEFLSDRDLDAVSICTPHALHPRNAIEGAEAGKHLFIEKPVALTLGELSATIDAVERAGVVTAVGFVTRGTPLARRLREVVASGAIGEIYMIGADYWHARRGRPHYYKTAEEAGSAYMNRAASTRWTPRDSSLNSISRQSVPRPPRSPQRPRRATKSTAPIRCWSNIPTERLAGCRRPCTATCRISSTSTSWVTRARFGTIAFSPDTRRRASRLRSSPRKDQRAATCSITHSRSSCPILSTAFTVAKRRK